MAGDASASVSAVLQLSGDIDAQSAPGYRLRADDVLSTPGLSRLVVDLGAVEFLDSAGISLLVEIRIGCVSRGVDLILRRLPRRTRTMLDLSGLGGAFRLVDPQP